MVFMYALFLFIFYTSDFLWKLDNDTLNERVAVYVKNDTNGNYLKEELHYHDNARIGPVVVTGKEAGIVLAKDEDSARNMTNIGRYACNIDNVQMISDKTRLIITLQLSIHKITHS